MNIHEYQAKQLFRDYGIPVPEGEVISSLGQLSGISEALQVRSVVKAQAHTGARGKAGGVVLVNGFSELETESKRLLGSTLVTHQTGPSGLPVNQLLIEAPTAIKDELYLSLLVDRSRQRIVVIASKAGGMNIEEVAATTPEKIINVEIDPAAGLQGYQCRKLAFALGLDGVQIRSFQQILTALVKLFNDKDASQIEINPLVVTKEDDLMALDAKINFDGTALFKHKDIVALRDVTQEDALEARAQEFDLNYITLDGNIGCMVNGAGLAMATMDLVKLEGGTPANFLDVGGGTTAERVTEAFKLILSDDKVQAILVNIFGGIVRCDLIAEGIIAAIKEVGIKIPVVVRLEGTNAEAGLKLLAQSDVPVETSADLTKAAKRVVALSKGEVS